ncbi:MAG: hypothetical protein ABH859_01180 [Pseudomonadota bacterium]
MIKTPKNIQKPQFGSLTGLLNTPERLWMTILLIHNREKALTIREFASISGLSLGFISKFSNILRENGFLKQGKCLQITEPGQLLNIVRDLYFFEGNRIASYYFEDSRDELLNKIKRGGKKHPYALTRMCGASLIAPFVRFEYVDFYVPKAEDITYWKDYLKLFDVEVSGNMNIVVPQDSKILTQTQAIKGWTVVNNIQLYLDLYKYPARGREQAEHLRERILKI